MRTENYVPCLTSLTLQRLVQDGPLARADQHMIYKFSQRFVYSGVLYDLYSKNRHTYPNTSSVQRMEHDKCVVAVIAVGVVRDAKLIDPLAGDLLYPTILSSCG